MTTADADNPRPAGTRGMPMPPAGHRGEDLPRPSAGPTKSDRANLRGCPFLVAESGDWRLDMPSRDHRCAAVTPPAPLSPEKQARLCLTPSHTGCATYVASQGARAERLGAPPRRRATRWGLARTTSVIQDPGGIRGRLVTGIRDRRRWSAVPAVIVVTTLFVLVLAGFRVGLATSPAPTTSPSADLTAAATAPAASRSATTPAPEPTAPVIEPSVPPAATGPAATFRTYRVESGDTLSAIANRFGVSVSAIVDLNDLEDANSLSLDQILLIP